MERYVQERLSEFIKSDDIVPLFFECFHKKRYFMEITKDGIILSCTELAAGLYGYTAEEVIGKNIMEVMPYHRWSNPISICHQTFIGDRVLMTLHPSRTP